MWWPFRRRRRALPAVPVPAEADETSPDEKADRERAHIIKAAEGLSAKAAEQLNEVLEEERAARERFAWLLTKEELRRRGHHS